MEFQLGIRLRVGKRGDLCPSYSRNLYHLIVKNCFYCIDITSRDKQILDTMLFNESTKSLF